MPTTTARRPKLGKLDQAGQDELLRSLFTKVPARPPAWDKLAAAGASDHQISESIGQVLNEAGCYADDAGRSCCWAATYGFPIWFGVLAPTKRPADLSASKLVMAIRRIFGIEWPKDGAPPKTSAEVQADFDGPPAATSVLAPQRIKPGKNGRSNGQLPQQNEVEIIELRFRPESRVAITLQLQQRPEGWAERLCCSTEGWLRDGRDASNEHGTTEIFEPHKAPPCQSREECLAFNFDRLQERFAGISRKNLTEDGRQARTAAIEDLQSERRRLLGGEAVAVTPPSNRRLTIIQEIDIPVGNIFPSPENPREDFDQAFLEQLGQSLLDHGQLTPLSVRTPNVDGHHEIIDGETRYRAARLKGIAVLRCSIVECSDGDAALARVLSYRQRRDLNPLEEARGLQLLLNKYGCSQRELETKIGLSQGQISNRIRLLKLSTPWQQRVISHEINATQARELAAWNEEPAVAAELDKEWKRNKGHIDFEHELRDAISQASHELKGYEYSAGANWSIDPKDAAVKESLRIKRCPGWNGKTEPRAFNVQLAEQLKTEAIAELTAKASKKSERSEASAKRAGLSPAERRQKTEQLKAQQAKKIYRYKIAWLQRRLLEIFDEGSIQITTPLLITWSLWFTTQSQEHARAKEMQKLLGGGKKGLLESLQAYAGDIDQAGPLLRQVLRKWLAHSFEGWRTDLPPATVESFALQAGIDVSREWRLDQDFLELFTKGGLIDLVGEWKLGMYFLEKKKGDIVGSSTLESLKRSELIDKIQQVGIGVKAPACLLKVKEVSLR
ncbi:MAG: hypothetical protein A3E01_03085 [Gammaproteobacteria bacterium RIFCSPHIGHO2_12_FULL_63_22]|nr:MAG: hypothetical protein A3E01_03085 [Gammaproteobacteria bacterium RIFCSPHIGHO2_12_FULL_63_22]